MPAAPQISRAEWAKFKPFVEQEYLIKGTPARLVREQLKTQYGVQPTLRTLKEKLMEYAFRKKIPLLSYAAMGRVIQELGENLEFTVPKMAGHLLKHLHAGKIIKEFRRKETNATKKGKPPPTVLDLETAHAVLHEQGITFRCLRIDLPQSCSAVDVQTHTKGPADHPGTDNAYDYDDDDDVECCSLRSDVSMTDDSIADDLMLNAPHPDADTVAQCSGELNLQNFQPGLHIGQQHASPHMTEELGQQPMSGVLPFAAAYCADLHCNIFPHLPEYKLASPAIFIARYPDSNTRIVSDPDFMPNDYTDDLGLNSGPELLPSRRTHREKLIEQALIDHYQRYDHDNHRRIALEFSAYYVSQLLSGHETLDGYNHVDRTEARNKLRVMLDQNNMQLLTHCYWVSSAIMSYDKIQQLLGFLEDCSDCIETSTSYLGKVLRPWIRLMVLGNRDYYMRYATESPRLSPAALEELETNFDASQQLIESIDYLSQHGHEGSHTHLILRVYHAWDLCHQASPCRGQFELLGCLREVEGKFGTDHLVTINCISMVARTYEKLSDPKLAQNHFDIALSRFKQCSKMLASRYYQLRLNSARLLLAEGRLLEAREKLEHVVRYRVQHIGVQAPTTWEAAEMLFDAMRRQGCGLEAQQCEAELTALYEEAWRNYPIEYLPRS